MCSGCRLGGDQPSSANGQLRPALASELRGAELMGNAPGRWAGRAGAEQQQEGRSDRLALSRTRRVSEQPDLRQAVILVGQR